MCKNLFIVLIASWLLLVQGNLHAQTGLNFQGVARSSSNVILASQPISIRLSILQGSASGNVEYTEIRKLTTNPQGLFTAVIGDADAISSLGNFNSINWKNTPKFLKIEMDPNAGNNFTTIGTTQFQYVAYAQFANSVNAENIVGILPIEKGGTGVSSIASLKTALAIDKSSIGLSNVENTSDLSKPISIATQIVLDTKASISDVNKALSLKINSDELSSGLLNKVDKVVGKQLSSNDFTTAEKTKLASISGINTGDQDLSNYATNIDLSTKESVTNKSTASDLGGLSSSDILYPTQKAVKLYVDANNSSGGISDGSITTIKLADGAINDSKLSNGLSKSKVGLGNVENTALSTWNGTSNLNTLGIITSGTWSGTTIGSNVGGAGTVNGLLKANGNGLVSAAIPGSDFLTPNGSAVNLTNFPVLNQNTTGNAATASSLATARNINGIPFDGSLDITINTNAETLTGTSLASSITGSNLTSVGIINTGTWSATVIGSNMGGAGTVNGILKANGGGLVNAAVAGIDFQSPLTSIQSAVLSNTSGINTGDETSSSIKTKLGVSSFFSGNYADLLGKPILFSGSYDELTNRPDLTVKENIANKSTDITADANSDIKFPSVKAVKSYVDASSANIANGSVTSIKISDGAVTDAKVSSISGSKVTGNILGNAATASKLEIARNINGVPFDGSSNITISASANAESLSGTNLNANITGSSLTSIGVLNNATINGKLIVGALSETSSTAILDVSSTTQGFLPPRMTLAQRIGITNPAQGLMIYCTNCGTYGEPEYYNGNSWLTLSGASTSKAIPTITITVGNYTYTANTPQGPNVATNSGTGNNYTFSYIGTGSTTYAASSTRPTNAGTYSVTVTVNASSDGNYTSTSSSAAFTIAKAVPIVTPTIGTYNYSLVTPTAQGPNTSTNTGTGSTYTYSYIGTGFTSYGPSATKPTDGGTYNVVSTVAASSDGNYASSSSSPTAFKISLNLALGNSYGGGKVAYILKSGDIGYDPNQQHGLIISGDLTPNLTDIIWGTFGILVGANGGLNNLSSDGYSTFVELGSGINNTNLIVAVVGLGTNYAAGLANSYRGGGYSDWYLPSYSELYGIRSNRNYIGTINRTFYWTSTEGDGDPYNAWLISLDGPSGLYEGDKSYANGGVKAVRVF